MPATKRKKKTGTMLAKIHPPSPPRYTVERYGASHKGRDYTFHASRGWYEVPVLFAMRLKKIRTNPNDPHSSQVFIVCSADEAEAMERLEEEVAAKAAAPIKIGETTDPIKVDPEPEVPEAEWEDDIEWEDDMASHSDSESDDEEKESESDEDGVDPLNPDGITDDELFDSDDEIRSVKFSKKKKTKKKIKKKTTKKKRRG